MEAQYVRAFVDKSQYKSSDPNNTFWAKDQSRFGLKMLKNMGWSEGRGLGANEEGTVSHIPIKKKLSNAGIGETNNSSDNWLQGAFEFNNVLKRLNSAKEPEQNSESKKEKKVNSSKKRHMYQNRLASRDASGYSKEDLALILGTKKLQAAAEKEEEEHFSESEDEDQFLTTTKVSVMDYFLKKGAASDETEVFETQEQIYDEEIVGGSGLGFSGLGHKRSREVLTGVSSEPEEPKSKKVKKEKKEKKDKKDKKKRKEEKSKRKSEKSKRKSKPSKKDSKGRVKEI